MKIARYSSDGMTRWGVVDGDAVHELDRSPFTAPSDPGDRTIDLTDVRLLAPCEPSKIVLASGNYHEVIRTMGKPMPVEPVIFIKPSTSVTGPDTVITWPRGVDEVTHEPELAVVIGRFCRRVSAAEAADYILGFTCLNDVSAWDVLTREVQFTRSKAYDTFAPMGPFIVSGPFEPNDLAIRSYVNGKVALETRTDDMVFTVHELVSFVSSCMTLLPGDVISTGASGVGAVEPGDVVEVEIEHVGRLSNRVGSRE